MKKLLLLIGVLLLTSCSNPVDRKYNEETMKEDFSDISEKSDLTQEDKKLMAGWIVAAKLKGEDLANKTYAEILKDAKDYKKEQEELAEKAKKEEEERSAKMKNALVVSIYDKSVLPKSFDANRYSDYNLFKYAIENKTDKEIKAIKMSFKIYNALGDEIGSGYNFDFTDDRIEPKGNYKDEIAYKVNQFDNDDSKLANAKFEDLIFDIKVDKIVYSDGSVLE